MCRRPFLSVIINFWQRGCFRRIDSGCDWHTIPLRKYIHLFWGRICSCFEQTWSQNCQYILSFWENSYNSVRTGKHTLLRTDLCKCCLGIVVITPPGLQRKSTGAYSQTRVAYYSTILYVLECQKNAVFVPFTKNIFIFFKYYGYSSSFFLCVSVFLRNICSNKISFYSFGVLKSQLEYYQNITKILVLLPLTSSHKCINTIFHIIRNQEKSYQIMKNELLFLIQWSQKLSSQKTLLLMLEQNSGVLYDYNTWKFDN